MLRRPAKKSKAQAQARRQAPPLGSMTPLSAAGFIVGATIIGGVLWGWKGAVVGGVGAAILPVPVGSL